MRAATVPQIQYAWDKAGGDIIAIIEVCVCEEARKRREAGRQGGREAGRQGGRKAGRQGGRVGGGCGRADLSSPT
jgi:hypothetical protein